MNQQMCRGEGVTNSSRPLLTASQVGISQVHIWNKIKDATIDGGLRTTGDLEPLTKLVR